MLTRLARDLRNGDFWRTVWMFVVTHGGEIESSQIGPMIDYIQAVRHERVRFETQDGTLEVFPPRPSLSIKAALCPLDCGSCRNVIGSLAAAASPRSPGRGHPSNHGCLKNPDKTT
jgi:hypothetical protein